MPTQQHKLDSFYVATPCPIEWNTMYGDDKVRFCKECKLNVYNISEMSQADAETLISNKEGELCVRYYKRADGTILTQDCPVGVAKFKRRVKQVATAMLSLTISIFTGLLGYWNFGMTANTKHHMGRMAKKRVALPILPSLNDANNVITPPKKVFPKYVVPNIIDNNNSEIYRQPKKDPFYEEQYFGCKLVRKVTFNEEPTTEGCTLKDN